MTQKLDPAYIESLREEIVESEKVRVDLLKYKLIAIAGLGAVGLGLSGYTGGVNVYFDPLLVLNIVPFVCAYVDLLCWHNTIRILVIARFLASTGDPYEGYIDRLGRTIPRGSPGYFFGLEDLALHWSTIFVSLLIFAFGSLDVVHHLFSHQTFSGQNVLSSGSLVFSGFLGIVVTVGMNRSYNHRVDRLFETARLLDQKRSSFPTPLKKVKARNHSIGRLMREKYTPKEIQSLNAMLHQKGVMIFPSYPNGLFSAAVIGLKDDQSGYDNVWVRDNVQIAYAHYVVGKTGPAIKNAQALMEYFKKHRNRFKVGRAARQDPMRRPHIRFNGETLDEIAGQWPHAQNDALGYFLWFYCLLAEQKHVVPGQDELRILKLFISYFKRIQYWKDEDSGHLEEIRHISASSIGTVVAGLKQLKRFLRSGSDIFWRLYPWKVTVNSLDYLIEKGMQSLSEILPAECAQPDPHQQRRYDSALLFLIHPLNVVNEQVADQILYDVMTNLQGEYGIRRYSGDSYWSPDYKKHFSPDKRSSDFSGNLAERDLLLPALGLEAQWCIFDSIISVIFGKRYQESRSETDLQMQVYYFNRSLAQITGKEKHLPAFRCPELYYLEKGTYVPNDHTPLLWTQANLMNAIEQMQISASIADV